MSHLRLLPALETRSAPVGLAAPRRYDRGTTGRPDTSSSISYCSVCDAPPGECSHTAHRYLDPITYERVADGFRVPPHERARWEAGEEIQARYRGRGPIAQKPADPYECPECSGPLGIGRRYCSKTCFLKAKAKELAGK